MATLYFNATVDSTWDNVSNWWQDNAFSVPAIAIPANGDAVYLEATVNTGPAVAVTLAALYLAQINNYVELSSAGAGISTTGDLTVGKSTYLSGTIYNISLTIGGTAYFYGNSQNEGTLTVSLSVFNRNSYNYSIIEGDATFNDSSYNIYSGVITGNATFNDSASNYYEATVEGSATFNDNTSNYSDATVDGNATFNNQSANNGTVSGNASVNYPVARPLGGTVTGTITYSGYPGEFYFNAAADGTWDNPLNWWRDSGFSTPAGNIPTSGSTVYIEANLTTGPTDAITLYNLFVAQINNGATLGSSGSGITVTGDLTVGVESSLYGRVDNSTININNTASFYGSNGGNSSILYVSSSVNFYGNTSNYGTGQGASSNGLIEGSVAFYDSAINYCTINGNAAFNNTSYNASGANVETATFNDSSYNASGATVEYSSTFDDSSYNAGSVTEGETTFNGSSYNTSGGMVEGYAIIFNDNSYNASGATVEGSATFYTNSYNNGLVSGDAYVYAPGARPLGGTVTGTITYYPPIYTLYFNASADATWDNPLNWWLDSGFSVAAGTIPTSDSTVYIEANLTTGPTAAITLAALYVAQINNAVTLGSSGAGITVTGNLTVGSGAYLYGSVNNANLTIGGTANFYGGAGGNSSTLTVASANFYLGSSNSGAGNITGNATFYNNAKNYSSIGGNATFSDTSSNNSGGDITGSATFNDSSSNASGGTVGGSATFKNNSSNASGSTVEGDATFKNNSSNSGDVSGNASVYYPVTRPIGGTVAGTITYINYP